MQRSHRLIAFKLLTLLLAAAASAGCACSCPRCTPTTCPGWQPSFGAAYGCFGYYSTCWRVFPPECAPCPSYAFAHVPPQQGQPFAPTPAEAASPSDIDAAPEVPQQPTPATPPDGQPANEMGLIVPVEVPAYLAEFVKPAERR